MNSDDPISKFEAERSLTIARNGSDPEWKELSKAWMLKAFQSQYMYNFTFLGRPIIQTPIDIVALQEIIWRVKPDLIIETGIAHGGSLILSAAMLVLLDYCDANTKPSPTTASSQPRTVLGIDIDIRRHNKNAIETHPLAHRIQMIEGSSIDPNIIGQVQSIARSYGNVLICLDSNHTHSHVLAELEAYAPLTTVGSYCCVFDTIVEDMPDGLFPDRPWGKGNNPKTAVRQYLRELETTPRAALDGKPLQFKVDREIEDKLLMTVAPNGFLKRLEGQVV